MSATSGEKKGRGFKREIVKEMVLAYRKNAAEDALKFSHFNAYQILKLMIKNEVIPAKAAIAIEAEMEHIQQFGLKIYLGNYVNDITLPQLPNSTPETPVYDERYRDRTTTILCNTVIEKGIVQDEFRDLLGHGKDTTLSFDDDIEPGDGLDQAEIEPPYHTNGNDCYDIGNNIPGVCI